MKKQKYSVNKLLSIILFLIIISVIFQIRVETNLAYSDSSRKDDLKPLYVRITEIEWNLSTLYQEYDTLNITLNLTIVAFQIKIEIWNPNTNVLSLEFPDSDEFSPILQEDLEESNLNLTPFWGSLTVITPRNYTPGITTKFSEYPFSIEKPNLTRLPNGLYSISVKPPVSSSTDILTYGLNLTVTDTDYSIEYDEFPYETTDATLSYVVSQCNCEDYSGWEDGDVSVTTENQSVKFQQILISWCNFDKTNLQINLFQAGDILIIQEVYNFSIITDCLCAYQISGQITNIETGNYSLIIQYETGIQAPQPRFTSIIPVLISDISSVTEYGIVVGLEALTLFLGLFFSTHFLKKQRS